MLQEWANLRAQGIKTPEIAAWQRMPVEGMSFSAANKARAIYPYVLNVYNDPRFSQVGPVRVQAAPRSVSWVDPLKQAVYWRHGRGHACKLQAKGTGSMVQVIMKDAVTRKKIFFIPRADQFDERWTADVQLNSERPCRSRMAVAGPAAT